VLSQTVENSLRLKLMQEFHKIELEAELEKDNQQQVEYSNSVLVESKNKEGKIENTPNS